MNNSDYIVFGAPCIGESEERAVIECLRSRWIGSGPRVTEFEKRFCEYKRAEHAIAVNSCTAALHIALRVSDLRPGDEVLVPALTFCATVNAIIHAGLRPVLVDVDEATFNLEIEYARRVVTSRTKAMVLVHFAGYPCDMDKACAFAAEYGLILIEDCAHAIETTFRGKAAGTFGLGCFSFYVTKNITTGEGGMILCQSEERAKRARVLALHGMSADAWRRFSDAGYRHYDVVDHGFKYNLTDIAASIGLVQLQKVAAMWRRREEIYHRYNEAFNDLPLITPGKREPELGEGSIHGYHLYTVLIDPARCQGVTRDAFMVKLHAEGIGTGVHYRAIPELSAFQRALGAKPSDFPVATKIGQQTVSIPLAAALSEEHLNRVCRAVERIFAGPYSRRRGPRIAPPSAKVKRTRVSSVQS